MSRRLPRKLAVLAAITALIAGVTGALAVFSDSGTVNVEVADKTTSKVDVETPGGAFVSYFGDGDTTFGSSGTGNFNPFYRLQGSPSEAGFNTNAAVTLDTKTGTWTHAIKVSEIPQRPCPDVNPSPPPAVGSLSCFELFVDINDGNSNKHISLNKVEVYFTDKADVSGYNGSGFATPVGNVTTQVYAFSGNILIQDVNQGSGRGDLRYDIPINFGPNPISLPTNCNYGNPLCATYFVLYSQWGFPTGPSATYNSDGGFEEWKVKVYPTPPDVSVAKTPDAGTINAGQDAVFTIVVTNNGPITATGVTLNDTLPATGSWTVGGANAAACTGTNPHAASSLLTCNFGDIPFPGSRTITLTSPTTASNCGSIPNTATVAATNEGPISSNNSDSGAITVQCAAIAILKESTKTGNPLVTSAGAVFSVTGPGSYSATVTDNGLGDEDSTIGKVCISGLQPGAYTVNETTAPSGYGGASQANLTATAVDGTNCGLNKPIAGNSATFTNAPLGEIEVKFKDLGSTETKSSIVCTGLTPVSENGAADPAFDDTDEVFTNLPPGTYNCQVVVDP